MIDKILFEDELRMRSNSSATTINYKGLFGSIFQV